ncbi:hypothetical protein BU23DRAFT_477316, partial [Bimuria novae-zelandiae CBS 107.79]
QEAELIKYIEGLIARYLPPTKEIIRNFALIIAKELQSAPAKGRLVTPQKLYNLPKRIIKINSTYYNANLEVKYKLYFKLLHNKIAKYSIESYYYYNIDKKGFLLSITSYLKRIFDRPLYKSYLVR